jgi:hypothetical protein
MILAPSVDRVVEAYAVVDGARLGREPSLGQILAQLIDS